MAMTNDLFTEIPPRGPAPYVAPQHAGTAGTPGSDGRHVVSKPATGAQLRDAAMRRAVDHADETSPRWADVAFEHLRLFAMQHYTLTCEQVRQHAEAKGFAKPPTRRAWGSIVSRAVRAGVITQGVYEKATDPLVHCRPIMRWRSLIACSNAAE